MQCCIWKNVGLSLEAKCQSLGFSLLSYEYLMKPRKVWLFFLLIKISSLLLWVTCSRPLYMLHEGGSVPFLHTFYYLILWNLIFRIHNLNYVIEEIPWSAVGLTFSFTGTKMAQLFKITNAYLWFHIILSIAGWLLLLQLSPFICQNLFVFLFRIHVEAAVLRNLVGRKGKGASGNL